MAISKNNARWLAVGVLDRVTKQHAYSNLQLNQVLQTHPLSDADRHLMTNIVYGVLQHKLTLDYWLEPFIGRKKIDNWVRVLLWTAIYQYHYLDRLPAYAVTNESIDIAKAKGNPGTRRLVTGILHAFLRKGARSFDELKDPRERLSVSTSEPRWLVDNLVHDYGQAVAEKVLNSFNRPAHLAVRVNTALTTVTKVISALANEKIEARPSQLAANGLVVESGNVLASSAFAKGLVTVQDESAQLAVESMDLQPDMKVLDACAAPGGKTTQIAEQLDPEKGGQVTSLDLHANKIRLIQRNAQRMGLVDQVNAQQMDSRKVGQIFDDNTFDAILVDAPCSGIGLLRRKPEIRYDKSRADSEHLHRIQLEILDAVAAKIKKGGIITYSTCTLLKRENDGTVRAFLQDHPDFKLIKTRTVREVKDDRATATLTILPSDVGSDGFFISSLCRIR
ncbi:16S rRNA (cytosine(967)-C(5))-methyltransferase RsmB [Limosilactobacillus sp.]|uniref:16S rRNA (cytosine(967)-C(5))-methyltransferase RsmB n=1 Tax=Limosilactobacillus sp. TaxID=2773925 RepID=UPI00345E9A86